MDLIKTENIMSKHNKWVVIFIIFLGIFLFGNVNAELTPVGKIHEMVGRVYLQHTWEAEPSIARINEDIFLKDRLMTGADSKASLFFINGATLDIGVSTDLEIRELYYRPSDALSISNFKMKLGRLRAFVGKFINPESRFEIETTTAVTGVIGTEQFVINEQTAIDGVIRDTTRAVCTLGRVWVGSTSLDVAETVILDPFNQVWVNEDEPPQGVVDVTIEELGGILQDVMISGIEDKLVEFESFKKEKKTVNAGIQKGIEQEMANEEKIKGPSVAKNALEAVYRDGDLQRPVAFEKNVPVEDIQKMSDIRIDRDALAVESSMESEKTIDEFIRMEENLQEPDIERESIFEEVIGNSLSDDPMEDVVREFDEMPNRLHQEVTEMIQIEQSEDILKESEDMIREIEDISIKMVPEEVTTEMVAPELPMR